MVRSGIGKLKIFAGAGPPGPLFWLGLGGVEAFFAPGAGPHLGHFFFGNFAGPGIFGPHLGHFSNMALDHTGTIFRRDMMYILIINIWLYT
jgi:hypothetical protein